MLVQNLAITYKCYSSIGNSLDLKEMMDETLKTFVSETYAIFAQYCIKNKDGFLEKLSSFGKIDDFNPNDYSHYEDEIKLIVEENRKILIIKLHFGSIFLVTKNMEVQCSFFISMFESFLQKLNMSVQACLNVEKLKETNKLLKEQKKALREANKAKDDFMANMSHELKTPLNSINVISSVMKKNKDGSLNEKQIKNLEIINSCGNYLLTLINDVLDISKLEAGRINTIFTKVILKQTLTEIYEMFLPQAKEKGVKLFFNFDDSINHIYSDDHKIKQIVKNLLSNALKFVGDGSIYLDVKDEDKYVTISVKDEGIGIPKEKLENIFDRFKQADNTTTRKYGGTGLGLAICKELLDLLKGTIYVKSEVDVGTTFYVTIPKNLDNLEHMDLLDLNNDHDLNNSTLPLNIDKSTENEIKEKVIVYNTNPSEFFKMIIDLQKDFEIIQVFKKYEIQKVANNEIKKIIIDIDTVDKDELNGIILEYSEKLIILTEDENLKFSNDIEIDVALKNEINSINKKIKGI
ncbi:sensor histidine kinase [Arcobacter arenosus]|uniref:sensor histidine kinase n=1 Tax=Arcobacter arenosus TaxID=2576037 RepID=UPI003BAA4AB6